MQLQLIRNATMKLSYAGKPLLTDPMLSIKGAFTSFAGKARNPTVELAMPVKEILDGVQGVLVSHAHPDHLDKAAIEVLPKDLPLFCQPGVESATTRKGFSNVTPVGHSLEREGITLTRTDGMHGKGFIRVITGKVSGFVLQARGEPTVYWVGDSIWCEPVAKAIQHYQPDVIITHSGGARFPGMKPIIMDGEQTIITAKAAPDATIIAVHMESLDHCGVTRKALRQLADKEGILPGRLLIPADGETLML
ncbi:MAG: MBL fold metallo-hydrolase [Okeania sp. SIO3B3]|nr:MBL fold metallo-hydrolase [Okeania sp. SIO3B3]